MAKQGGMGAWGFVDGIDLSGDVASLSKIGGGPNLLDFTAINKSAHERKGALLSGEISFSSYFNPTLVTGAHPNLDTLPTADRIVSYLQGSALGDPVASIIAKQVNYDANRGNDGSLMFGVQGLSNAYPLEWGDSLTAGKRTDTAATNGTAIDSGTNGAAVTITSGSAANPTVVTAVAHGLVTGDSILISGTDKAALNNPFTVTVTGVDTFTVPVDLSGGAAAGGTFLKTSTNFGASAYLHTFGVTGTSMTVTIQDSADNSTFATLIAAFTTVAAGVISAERKQSTTATAIVRRYVRAITTGTFNPGIFAVGFTRHLTSSLQ